MAENLTDWQKIAAIYRKVTSGAEDISGQAFDLAIGVKLAGMVKEDAGVIAYTTGVAQETGNSFNYQLAIMTNNRKNYFLIYPDDETAISLGKGYIHCKLGDVLRLVYKTPQVHGLQLVIEYDKDTKKFVTGEITKNMIAMALNM